MVWVHGGIVEVGVAGDGKIVDVWGPRRRGIMEAIGGNHHNYEEPGVLEGSGVLRPQLSEPPSSCMI